MFRGYQGEGHHANYDTDDYVKPHEDPGNPSYVSKDEILDPNPLTDPEAAAIAAEEAEVVDGGGDEENDTNGDDSLNDELPNGDWVPLSKYGHHNVATGEEAEVANIPGSGKKAPRMPRLNIFEETNKQKKPDWLRGKQERGKR